MAKVLKREMIVPNIHELVLASSYIPRNAKAGNFVIVRVDEFGERIPLNLIDWNQNSISTVFMEVGTSTRKMAALKAGDEVADVLGPLGKPTEMVQNQTVMCIGGCYGVAALYPVVREYKRNNNRVITVLEARSDYLLFWKDKYKEFSDEIVEITRDGTKGIKGHANDFINSYIAGNKVDLVYGQGCTFLTYLISQTTKPSGIKTIVALNPIMIDATGMCGVCRVTVGGKMKFACVDGPEFDGHQVDWDNLLTRRHAYIPDERKSLSFYECETYG
jgi:ferredoxin/flavodoxin---NADP+ reductase